MIIFAFVHLFVKKSINSSNIITKSTCPMICDSPEVSFAGYSVPHPSENVVNVRVQTNGDRSASAVFRDSLADLSHLCDIVKTEFKKR